MRLTTKRLLETFAVMMVASALLLTRVFVAFGNQVKITDAIFVYQMECIRSGEPYEVTYDDAESIDRTIWRLWDFSHKRILPREKYVKIAKYIGVDYTLYAPDEYAATNEELWAAIAAAMPAA